MATAVNKTTMPTGGCVNANPRAVPKNGAVQGVASTVASMPLKNAPMFPLREAAFEAALVKRPPVISKTPKKLSATSVTRRVMRTRN